MTGFQACTSSSDRGCWLKHPNGTQFNITTDYEAVAPVGVVRKYSLSTSDMTYSPDGFANPGGQLFNKVFPGPLLEACWGDTFEVTVTNNLKYNGTTVHWHGLRQLGTNEMDGVNGVTQCGIAPGQSMTYTFAANQYGNSWYHSHYTLQYVNGLFGPMSLYGPSSSNYNSAVDTLLIQDYDHRDAFEDFYTEIAAPPFPGAPPPNGPVNLTTILLNGGGYVNCTAQQAASNQCGNAPPLHEITFQKGQEYLLSLVNTASGSIFTFSIDNHQLTVVESDFVPVKPFTVDSLNIAIGQRYQVIVTANPVDMGSGIPSDDNFWIRTSVNASCNANFRDGNVPDARTGIVRYNAASTSVPTSSAGNFAITCADVPASSLVPMVPWQVGPPVNDYTAQYMDAALTKGAESAPHGGFNRWSLGNDTLWLDYLNPTIFNFSQPVSSFSSEKVIVPEPYTANEWVYFLISENQYSYDSQLGRIPIPAGHPIHMHGHDFVVLEQSSTPYNGQLNLDLNNPARRDTALLMPNGYLAIAYRSDNPGAWILHCHIANHVAAGLGIQVLEAQSSAAGIYSGAKIAQTQQTCQGFKSWYSNKSNWWNPTEFQDDSGV